MQKLKRLIKNEGKLCQQLLQKMHQSQQTRLNSNNKQRRINSSELFLKIKQIEKLAWAQLVLLSVSRKNAIVSKQRFGE